MTTFTYLVSLDTTKTLTKGDRYRAVKDREGMYKLMCDDGICRWIRKNHFVREVLT